jgi:hypothetical protein
LWGIHRDGGAGGEKGCGSRAEEGQEKLFHCRVFDSIWILRLINCSIG